MVEKILINKLSKQTRVAILKNNQINQLFYEHEYNQSLVGNIYLGVIKRHIKDVGVAFIDIGLEQNAFLQIKNGDKTNFKEGESLLVQVTKDGLDDKGCGLSKQIKLVGKYVVLLVNEDYVGITKKITDEAKRASLVETAYSLKPDDHGIILRTSAEIASKEYVSQEINMLIDIWLQKIKPFAKSNNISLIHKELALPYKVIRDYSTNLTDEIIVDCPVLFKNIEEYLSKSSKVNKTDNNNPLITLHSNSLLFDFHQIENTFSKIPSRKTWLKSGGYIVIDYTEAMTVFDVNSGKGTDSRADIAFKTNIEASIKIGEIIIQRNIGGIIIIDFIDLIHPEEKAKVAESISDILKSSNSPFTILPINEFGLLQITRKRTNAHLYSNITDTCTACSGSGATLKLEYVAYNLLRDLQRLKPQNDKQLTITLPQNLHNWLIKNEKEALNKICASKINWIISPCENTEHHKFNFYEIE